jgi:hypothetical protein
MTKEEKKLDQALLECYTLLYAASEPKGDFQALMDNSEKNELGQKVIPMDDYEIDCETMEEIVNLTIKKYKLKGFRIQQFRNTIYLGCSPKTKIK